ncbi:MAG: metallophosphoesterase [Oscillospiraceae bacterium]|jgi:predicted phosphohydrolase|nr:metallophosphoesterase [Oscillospiraceae bacterium]
MALYVIGDTHLSLGAEKPMDVFGGNWEGYTEKLRRGFSVLGEGDTIVLAGDISWGMRLTEALPDFRFLSEYPGRKILVKGNHDYWWDTLSKMNAFFAESGLDDFEILHNNCFLYKDIALCGTRGWFYEEDRGSNAELTHDRRIFLRELGRLEASLKAAESINPREIYAFLHYPPVFRDFYCAEIIDLFAKYGVSRCFYGHIHGETQRWAFEGTYGAVTYSLIAADRLGFVPRLIER